MSNWTTAEPVAMKILLILLFLFSFVACDGASTGGSNPTAPQQTTTTNNATDNGSGIGTSNGLPLDLSNLRYSTGVSDTAYSGEERGPLTLCDLVNNEIDYVGLVEVLHVGDSVTSPICSEQEYRSIHRVIQLERIADAHVSPVVTDTVISANWIAMGQYLPRTGDFLLTTVRESQGELFLGQQLIALPSDYDAADPYERKVDVPSDFDELTARTTQILADYQGECPDVISLPLDDATYATWIRDPECSSNPEGEEDVDVDIPRGDMGSVPDPGTKSDAGM